MGSVVVFDSQYLGVRLSFRIGVQLAHNSNLAVRGVEFWYKRRGALSVLVLSD